MSAVPPNMVGPILQSSLTARQVSNARSGEEAQRTSADRKQTAAIDERDTTVETTDNDTQVHTDAEGLGSQGRAFSRPEDVDPEAENDDQPAADDQDAGRHIDFEA